MASWWGRTGKKRSWLASSMLTTGSWRGLVPLLQLVCPVKKLSSSSRPTQQNIRKLVTWTTLEHIFNAKIGFFLITSFLWTPFAFGFVISCFNIISTEGALGWPLTFDDHPSAKASEWTKQASDGINATSHEQIWTEMNHDELRQKDEKQRKKDRETKRKKDKNKKRQKEKTINRTRKTYRRPTMNC